MKTELSTYPIRASPSSPGMVLIGLVNIVGAAVLLLPAFWTAYSVSEMSGTGRGYSDLDNAIRGEENFKVFISLAIFVAIAVFFLVIDLAILAVRQQLRNGKAWSVGAAVLLLPSLGLFGYFTVLAP